MVLFLNSFGVHCTIVSPIFRSPTRVALVVPFRFPFLLQFFPPRFPLYTHNASRILQASCSASCSSQAVWLSSVVLFSCFASAKMVEHLLQEFTEHEERLRRNNYVPRFSYGRRMLRDDGDPNRYVLMYL